LQLNFWNWWHTPLNGYVNSRVMDAIQRTFQDAHLVMADLPQSHAGEIYANAELSSGDRTTSGTWHASMLVIAHRFQERSFTRHAATRTRDAMTRQDCLVQRGLAPNNVHSQKSHEMNCFLPIRGPSYGKWRVEPAMPPAAGLLPAHRPQNLLDRIQKVVLQGFSSQSTSMTGRCRKSCAEDPNAQNIRPADIGPVST
jgi:hypothetical protein